MECCDCPHELFPIRCDCECHDAAYVAEHDNEAEREMAESDESAEYPEYRRAGGPDPDEWTESRARQRWLRSR